MAASTTRKAVPPAKKAAPPVRKTFLVGLWSDEEIAHLKKLVFEDPERGPEAIAQLFQLAFKSRSPAAIKQRIHKMRRRGELEKRHSPVLAAAHASLTPFSLPKSEKMGLILGNGMVLNGTREQLITYLQAQV